MDDPLADNPETTGNTGNPTGMGPDRESSAAIPRWVKVIGIVVVVLILLFVVLQLIGVGGSHGPSRHTGGLGVSISLSSVTTLF